MNNLKCLYLDSNEITNIKTKINDKIYEIEKLQNFNLNFIPLILTPECISIINKCKKESLNLKRIDKTSDIKKINFDNFLYVKRLDHINHKKPFLKVFIGIL